MLDNQLFTLIINTIVAAEANLGIAGMPIAQAFQPTNQGVNTQPTAYLWKIGDKRIGSPQRTETMGDLNLTTELGANITTEGQLNLLTELGLNIITESGFNLITEQSQDILAENILVHTEAQWYETTFQISCLVTQNPATPMQYTASDILNLIAYILQSTSTIAAFNAQGIGILRVMDVRNPYFRDDRGQFDASPSLDFVITHQQIIQKASDIISSTVINIIEI